MSLAMDPMQEEIMSEGHIASKMESLAEIEYHKEDNMELTLNSTIDDTFRNIGLNKAQRFAVGLHILSCFSGAIGHRPYLKTAFNTYGNLNMVLLGKSGIGKGASKKYALEIFSGFGEDVIAPLFTGGNISCKKALFRGIYNILSVPARAHKGEVRIFHINVEFGSALRRAGSSYLSELGNSICMLIDGERIEETFGKQKIYFPLVHYSSIYHIQPEELTRCMRAHLIYSGMVNRFLWFELAKDLDPALPEMFQEVKTALEDEIRTSIDFATAKREIRMTPEAYQRFEDIKAQYHAEKVSANEVVCNLASRCDYHILQLALNLAMLRRLPEVDLQTLEDALALTTLSRKTCVKYMMEVVPHTLGIIITDYLKEKGPKTSFEIIADLKSPRTSEAKIKKELGELKSQGVVKMDVVDKDTGFFPQCYSLCE